MRQQNTRYRRQRQGMRKTWLGGALLLLWLAGLAAAWYALPSDSRTAVPVVAYAGAPDKLAWQGGAGIEVLQGGGGQHYMLWKQVARLEAGRRESLCAEQAGAAADLSFSGSTAALSQSGQHRQITQDRHAPKMVVSRSANGDFTLHLKQGAARVLAAPQGGGQHYRLPEHGEAWVLWGSRDGVENRYDYALSLQAVRHDDCRRAYVRAVLFGVSPSEEPLPQRLFAFGKDGAQIGGAYPLPHDAAGVRLAQAEEYKVLQQVQAAGVAVKRDGRIVMAAPGVARLPEGEAAEAAKLLYHTDKGQFVKRQFDEYNLRFYAGLRFAAAKPAQTAVFDRLVWHMYSERQVYVQQAFSEHLYRYLSDPLADYGHWVFTRQNDADRVFFESTLPEIMVGQTVRLFTVGRLDGVSGASVRELNRQCGKVLGCGFYELTVERQHIRLNVIPATDRLHDRTPIRITAARQVKPSSANGIDSVHLETADGVSLLHHNEISRTAWDMNLAGLVGVTPKEGLRALIAQEAPAFGSARAKLTLRSNYQKMAADLIRCIGQHGDGWYNGRCKPRQEKTARPVLRESAILLMDAETGAILAAANGGSIPKQGAFKELAAYNRYHPSHSPLRQHAWQHDGGVSSKPASTFKLITAVSLLQAAQKKQGLSEKLTGLSPEGWNEAGKKWGFDMASMCYPAPCGVVSADAGGQLHNSNRPPLEQLNRHRRFGLAEALQHSSNSWFGFMAERYLAEGKISDKKQTLSGGQISGSRVALQQTLHDLGIDRSFSLDGGLLEHADDSVLSVSPTTIDPLRSNHELRQMAIGLRMQTTPLSMASVAAYLATGHYVRPYLVSELNGQAAKIEKNMPPELDLSLIRQGMRGVVDAGTAEATFRRFGKVRTYVYGKTGTSGIKDHQQQDEKQRSENVAWFVGYIEKGALPRQNHPLAFAVKISYIRSQGGREPALIIAEWLNGLLAQQGNK